MCARVAERNFHIDKGARKSVVSAVSSGICSVAFSAYICERAALYGERRIGVETAGKERAHSLRDGIGNEDSGRAEGDTGRIVQRARVVMADCMGRGPNAFANGTEREPRLSSTGRAVLPTAMVG